MFRGAHTGALRCRMLFIKHEALLKEHVRFVKKLFKATRTQTRKRTELCARF